jgi:competence protein ComEA
MKRASKFLIAVACALAACAPVYAAALININTASHEELVTLKGIGDTYAARIIAYRNEHGPFKTIEDIEEVKGIGPATFANIKDSITVEYVAPEPKAAPTGLHDAASPTPKPAATIIPKAEAAAPALPQNQTAAAPDALPASAGDAPFPLAAALLGLAGLAGLGAAGMWLAQPQKPAKKEEETSFDPEEFIIE